MNNTTVNYFRGKEKEILEAWVDAQMQGILQHKDVASKEEFAREARLFLDEFIKTLTPGMVDVSSREFEPLKKMIVDITKSRTLLGFSAKETALFIFSLKSVLIYFLKDVYGQDPQMLLNEINNINELVDELGTITYDTFIEDREEIIQRQRQELLEASTPVIKLWDGILGVPIIGTIDSQRSQQIMDTLLNAIVNTGYDIAIIDISGVSTLDTLTAQHIIKTASAARLMGATCIISGISPSIAQTIVSLNLNLGGTKTKGSMSEAIKEALKLIDQKPLGGQFYGKDSDSQNGRSVIGHNSK